MNSLFSEPLSFKANSTVTYEYTCDIFGLAEYIYDCRKEELKSYFLKENISVISIEINGFNVICKLACAFSAFGNDDFKMHMNMFARKIVRELSIICLQNCSTTDASRLREELFHLSNREATICISYNTGTAWFIGNKNVYSQVEHLFSSTSTRRNAYNPSSYMMDDGISSIYSEPIMVAQSYSQNPDPYESRSAMDTRSVAFSFRSQNAEPFDSHSAMDTRSVTTFRSQNADRFDSHSAMDTRSVTTFRSQNADPFDSHSAMDTRSATSFSSHNTFPKQYPSSGLDYSLRSPFISWRNRESRLHQNNTELTEPKKPFNPLNMKHTPSYSLNKGGIQCPLYSVVFHTTSTRLSVGHNLDFATYLLTSLFDEFTRELNHKEIQIDGYFLNDHGFFVIVPPGTKDSKIDNVFNLLSNKYTKKLLRSQRLRIPLDPQTYLNYLIYIAEKTKGKVVVHRVNEESIYFYGDEEEMKKVFEEAQSISKDLENLSHNVDDCEEKLKAFEDTILPLTSVTSNQLQQVWKQGYTPRQLDSVDIAFNCYLSRCRRKELIEYVRKLLSGSDAIEITNVINCTDNYYLIFKGPTAPNRDRWKKYKSKVNPKDMGIDFDKRAVQSKAEPELNKLREQIEKKSEKKVTLWVTKDEMYFVGERSAVHELYNSLSK